VVDSVQDALDLFRLFLAIEGQFALLSVTVCPCELVIIFEVFEHKEIYFKK